MKATNKDVLAAQTLRTSIYVSVSLLFWLFGPHFMRLSTLVLIPVLYFLDRTPEPLADDYR